MFLFRCSLLTLETRTEDCVLVSLVRQRRAVFVPGFLVRQMRTLSYVPGSLVRQMRTPSYVPGSLDRQVRPLFYVSV